MKFFDISLWLKGGMAAWPGDTRFKREEHRGTAIVSKITMSSHTGTHIDAPRHFLFDDRTIDEIAISKLIGQCRVIEIRPPFFPPQASGLRSHFGGVGWGGSRRGERSKPSNQIRIFDVKKFNIKTGDRILFKTRNSELLKKKKFDKNYVSLSLEAARYLAKKKIDLVGIDYFGIEAKGSPGHPVHKTLLRAGIVIVEGLDLRKVKPGRYNLAALPLKLMGADGAPARAVLWR